MARLTITICIFFLVILLISCTEEKDFVLLDMDELEILNDTNRINCHNHFDENILIDILRKNDIKYLIKDSNIYVEKRIIENKNIFDNISRGIQKELLYNSSIPEGYVLFKYRKLNLRTNKYETRPLDEVDDILLPSILEKNGFDYIVKANCLYVEKELIDNQDFLSKVVDMLDHEREARKRFQD